VDINQAWSEAVAINACRRLADAGVELIEQPLSRHDRAGLYANVSIFDVPDNQALHDTLIQLPLYPYMDIEVMAVCRHPSSIHADDS
jgi:muconolactone delta-isomerase